MKNRNSLRELFTLHTLLDLSCTIKCRISRIQASIAASGAYLQTIYCTGSSEPYHTSRPALPQAI